MSKFSEKNVTNRNKNSRANVNPNLRTGTFLVKFWYNKSPDLNQRMRDSLEIVPALMFFSLKRIERNEIQNPQKNLFQFLAAFVL